MIYCKSLVTSVDCDEFNCTIISSASYKPLSALQSGLLNCWILIVLSRKERKVKHKKTLTFVSVVCHGALVHYH